MTCCLYSAGCGAQSIYHFEKFPVSGKLELLCRKGCIVTGNQTTAVLIPCLNEEKTIGRVVTAFRQELPDAQIYVYDNASDDRTSEFAAQAGAIVRIAPERGRAMCCVGCCVISMPIDMCLWMGMTPIRRRMYMHCSMRLIRVGIWWSEIGCLPPISWRTSAPSIIQAIVSFVL